MPKKLLVSFIFIITCSLMPIKVFAAGNVYVISGRGYGHAVGMSQYGAKGYAERNRSYSKILYHYFQKTELKKSTEKTLRVLVASERKSIDFSAKKDFSIYSEGAKKRYLLKRMHKYRISIYDSRFLIKDLTEKKDIGKFMINIQLYNGGGIVLNSADDNGITNNVYRGKIRVVSYKNRLYAVNHVHSEHYLFSVIPREMPTSWHMEALKAQAVAARSYALASMKNRGFFDLYTTIRSQVYTGQNVENERSIAAVKGTSGQILTYGDKVIRAYFYSSSGGYTENNENVWGGKPIAWLRARLSPYEGKSAVWPKEHSFSKSDLEKKLGIKGGLRGFALYKKNGSHRISKVKIVSSNGTKYLSGDSFRRLLRLRSARFNIREK